MLKLLCITAHPDDEAGGFGGSLLLYGDRGVETHVLCLTPGQAASHRGGARSDEELSAMRRKEFTEACAYLKVSKGEVLNYRDGRLDHENLYEVVGELVKRIRQIRPQVVMTFGSEGAITAHPDHSMAGIFATLAFQWAGRTNRYPEQLNTLSPYRPQKLYYGTADFTLPERQPVALAPASAFIPIGSELLERKIAAFKKHSSQAPLFELFETNTRRRRDEERFLLVASVKPGEIHRETDLFDGVVDD